MRRDSPRWHGQETVPQHSLHQVVGRWLTRLWGGLPPSCGPVSRPAHVQVNQCVVIHPGWHGRETVPQHSLHQVVGRRLAKLWAGLPPSCGPVSRPAHVQVNQCVVIHPGGKIRRPCHNTAGCGPVSRPAHVQVNQCVVIHSGGTVGRPCHNTILSQAGLVRDGYFAGKCTGLECAMSIEYWQASIPKLACVSSHGLPNRQTRARRDEH